MMISEEELCREASGGSTPTHENLDFSSLPESRQPFVLSPPPPSSSSSGSAGSLTAPEILLGCTQSPKDVASVDALESPETSDKASVPLESESRLSKLSRLKVDIPVELIASNTGSTSSSTAMNAGTAPKSPINVQEWVDSIDISSCDRSRQQLLTDWQKGTSLVVGRHHQLRQTTSLETATTTTATVAADETDNLGLGAEALHLEVEEAAVEIDGPSSNKRKRLVSNRENNKSFQSELSATSTTSSVSALLETMRDDPEEILENLGFGISPESSSPLARIPHRFLLRPSMINGNDLAGFLERHEEMQEINDTALSGYLGLSGYRSDGHSPSGIVSKILEKILERKRELKQARLSQTVSSTIRPSLFQAAFSVMAVNAFRNFIRPPMSTINNNSILDPKNRRLLENRTTTAKHKRSRRLVLGKHSLTLNSDEELVDDESQTRPRPVPSEQTSVCSEVSLERQMSDDVFLPMDKQKTSSSGILQISSTTSRECIEQLNSDASNKKSNYKLNRQLSIHEEADSGNLVSSNVDDDLSHHHHHQQQQQQTKLQLGMSKESFELEELNTTVSDGQEWSGASIDGRIHAECADTQRTSSAMSVSSGFLECEALDTIKDGYEVSSQTPNMTFETDCDIRNNLSRPLPPMDSHPDGALDASEPILRPSSCREREMTSALEILAEFTRNDLPNESEALVVLNDSTNSSSDVDDGSTRNPSSYESEARRRPSSRTRHNFISKLTKSRSEANLSWPKDRSSSPSTSSDQDGFTRGTGRVATLTRFWSNVGSDSHLNSSKVEGKQEQRLPRFPFKKLPSGSAQIPAFNKSYTTEMARMREVVRNYTAQLRDVERSCWETYHRLFPGLTQQERKELRMLGELRRRILEEASRTSSLLQGKLLQGKMLPPLDVGEKSSSFRPSDEAVQLYIRPGESCTRQSNAPHGLTTRTSAATTTNSSKDGVVMQLGERPHRTINSQSIPLTFEQMKQDILQEVSSLLRTDQHTFLQDIQATRREIVEVKEVISGLMTAVHTLKRSS